MRWNEVLNLNEGAVFSGFDQMPDWTGHAYGTPENPTAPVAEYQKRTRLADQPVRAWVFKNKSKFYFMCGDREEQFTNPQALGAFLDENGFIDFVGISQVNL